MQNTTLKKKRTFAGKVCLTLFILLCIYAVYTVGKLIFLFSSVHPDPSVASGFYAAEIATSLVITFVFLIVGLPLGYLTWRTRAK